MNNSLIKHTSQVTLIEPGKNSKGPMDSPWPMKSRDVFHTGQSLYSTENNIGAIQWTLKTYDDGAINSGIVIDADGVLYFGDTDWYFYAVYPNGTLKWKYKLSGSITSTPALAEDGTIYIGCWGNHLYALNSNGTLKWRFDALNSITSSPTIAADGTVYFGTMGWPDNGYRIYAVNPDGSLKWYYKTGNSITSDPAIGSDGTIYIGSLDSFLYAMNPDGTLKWRYDTGDEIHSHPSIGTDGTIYIGSNDYYFYSIQPDGNLNWKYRINGQMYSSAAIDSDGTVYAPDHDLYAFNSDGTVKWIFDFGDNLVSSTSPAIAQEGTIYIGITVRGVHGGYIVAINPDGSEQWRRDIGNYWVESSPTISADGTVYIGTCINDPPNGFLGYLYAFGEGNTAPEVPSIVGSETGKTGEKYTYTIKTTDLNNDNIYYYVNWGDGTNTGWKGPYESGTELSLSHTWNFQGTYPIKAKAKDETGLESEWSTLEVSMPKTRVFQLLNNLNQYFNFDFFQLFKYC